MLIQHISGQVSHSREMRRIKLSPPQCFADYHLKIGFMQCNKLSPDTHHLSVTTAITDNCHQYFTGTVRVGHDLTLLRKNLNFFFVTARKSAATINHSKGRDPEEKFQTGS